mmetsp:Transcript_6969/g.14184  ORF Transcript_6969/g.14184 Transcript_6969/m.14184 type:complete len:210 (+) Transcript_6969:84-713(+)
MTHHILDCCRSGGCPHEKLPATPSGGRSDFSTCRKENVTRKEQTPLVVELGYNFMRILSSTSISIGRGRYGYTSIVFIVYLSFNPSSSETKTVFRHDRMASVIVSTVQLQSALLSIKITPFSSFWISSFPPVLCLYCKQCSGRNCPCLVRFSEVMVATVSSSMPMSRTSDRMYVPPPHSTWIRNFWIGLASSLSLLSCLMFSSSKSFKS